VATIFKNPALTDYFLDLPEVTTGSPPSRSYVPEYEGAKILCFPNLKLNIDHKFWADLPSDQYAGMKKFLCHIDPERQGDLIQRALKKGQAPPELCDALLPQISSLVEQVMPVYYALFQGYTFSAKRAVFRLNTIYNENLHFDSYKEELPEHFARLFINLDTQPRIWHTSYTVAEISDRFGRTVAPVKRDTTTSNRFWRELNLAAFNQDVEAPRPRHVIYFDPGDVWAVESRQISHQIFYGRRAVSFDFSVPVANMLDPGLHYLTLSERYREAAKAAG
jgi:hypothetical protein